MAPHGTRKDSGNSYSEKLEPYKGWNNDPGFENNLKNEPRTELAVSGKIPSYAAGVLYRTGPGGNKLQSDSGKEFSVSHWFDGFAKVHRFELQRAGESMKVFYNSRVIVDEKLEKMRRTGDFSDFSFAQKRDPCESFFKKAQTVFKSVAQMRKADGKSSENVSVTLSFNMPGNPVKADPAAPNLYTKTDSAIYQRLNPETLEPIGIARQDVLHPDLKGPMSASHAKSDPVTGDVFNFNLNFGMRPEYKVFRVSAQTGKTDILATFTAQPAYLHSFFLTEDHVILCVWGSYFTQGGASILVNTNILDSIAPFDANVPAKWFVVDRKHGKGVLAKYESPAFFCFHTINAWAEESKEKPGEFDIVCDLSAYENLDVMKVLYYESVMSTSPRAKELQEEADMSILPFLCRYRLPAVPSSPTKTVLKAELEWSAEKFDSVELPTLNGNFVTKKHRYVYGVVTRGNSSFVDGIIKFDTETRKPIVWEREHHSPGEAIFVPNPSGADEDDGVLLSVVLDGDTEKSYLLCLNAKDMTELGRADYNGVVNFGFHGLHVPIGGKALDL